MKPQHRSHRASKSHTAGFSLIELMVVVTITAILAAVAIPTMTGYIYKSRTSEATEHIGLIKLRQEAYRSEFGLYAQISAILAVPGAMPAGMLPQALASVDGDMKPWPGDADWAQLGAEPNGEVRFSYGMAAGLPTQIPTAAPYNWPVAEADHWFLILAATDFDGDNDTFQLEANSLNHGLWMSHTKGWD